MALAAWLLPLILQRPSTDCIRAERPLTVAEVGGAYQTGRREGFGLVTANGKLWRVSPGGLTGYALTDPTQPHETTFRPLAGRPRGAPVAIGNRLFVATDFGLAVVSVDDPAVPLLQSVWPIASSCSEIPCAASEASTPAIRDLETDGNSLWLVVEESAGSARHSVQRLDPGSGAVLAQARLSGARFANEIALGGATIDWPFVRYLSSSDTAGRWTLRRLDAMTLAPLGADIDLGTGAPPFRGPQAGQGGAIRVGAALAFGDRATGTLRIVDLQAAGGPASCAALPLEAGIASSLVALGSRLFFVDDGGWSQEKGLTEVDLTTACSPRMVTRFRGPTKDYSGGLLLTGDRLLATDDRSGVRVVATVPSWSDLGAAATERALWFRSVVRSADGRFGYLATGGVAGGLAVCDTVLACASAARVDLPDFAGEALAASGSLLAIGADDTFGVYRLTGPGTPEFAGKRTVEQRPIGDFDLDGSRLAIAAGRGTVELWSLSDPSAPSRFLTVAQGEEDVLGVDLAGNRVFLVLGSGGLTGFDIADLTRPTALGSFRAPSTELTDVVAVGGYLYAADFGSDGTPALVVVDARASGAWTETKRIAYPSDEPVRSLALFDGRLHVPHGSQVDVYDLTAPSAPLRVDRVRLLDHVRAVAPGSGDWLAAASGEIVHVANSSCWSFDFATRIVGLQVQFEMSASAAVQAVRWSFGDGATAQGEAVDHAYSAPGVYRVRATALASDGISVLVAEREVAVGEVWSVRQVIPGVARVAGSGGSAFRTSLWAANRSEIAARVRLRFVPAVGFGSGGADEPVEVEIPPFGQLAVADVLGELFAADGTTGVILIESAGSAAPRFVGRTFNATEAGTYGQYIPSVEVAAASDEVWLHGLGGNAAFRSNVGVVNLTGQATSATVALFDSTGQSIGSEVAFELPAWSALQKNRINEAAGAGERDVFSARVRSTAPFFAYASRLDNRTSDPIFLPAGRPPAVRSFIDGVARAAGAGGTFFRSELSLTAAAAANVTLRFTPRGASAPTASALVELAANESRLFGDVLGDAFALDGVAGALAIEATTPVVAWTRTYNDLGAGGTFGQFIPAFADADLIPTSGALLLGLSEDAAYRTNAGWINVGTATVDLVAEAWSKAGKRLGEKVWTIAPGQAVFASRVLANIPGVGSEVGDAYLRLLPSSGGALYAWASLVDNRSTDQTFVRPVVESPGVRARRTE